MESKKKERFPSIRQLLEYSQHLRDKYKVACSIHAEPIAYDHNSDHDQVVFWVYVADTYGEHHMTWKSAYAAYISLMEAEIE